MCLVNYLNRHSSMVSSSEPKIFGRVKEKAVEGAKATDEAVREHPYQAIAIGVGVGALLGFLLARRNCK